MGLVKEDIAKIIADSVPAAVAMQMNDFAKEADARQRAAKKTDMDLMAETIKANTPEPQQDIFGYEDRKGGKGLDCTRMLFADAEAKITGLSSLDIAHKKGKQRKEYRKVAELIEARSMPQKVNHGNFTAERALSASDFTAAGALVATSYGEMIQLLYANTVINKAGATRIDFEGELNLGRLNQGATAGYVGEAQAGTASKQRAGNLILRRKKLMSLVPVTNEMIRKSNLSIEAKVRDDMLMALALRRDISILRGVGSEASPKGISNQMVAANKFTQTGTALAAVITDHIKLVSRVAQSNTMRAPAWFMNPRHFYGLLALTDGNGNQPFLAQLALGKLWGFDVFQTTQIPIDLAPGTVSEVYFGDAADLIDGNDVEYPIQAEFFPNASFIDENAATVFGINQDQSIFRAMVGHDCLLQHDNSFAMLTGVTLGA